MIQERVMGLFTRGVFSTCLLALTLAAPVGAQTQITTGIIQGSVNDATGASLPGVSVEARNLDTNLSRTLVTEADGRFVFLQLPPGNYRVTFTLSGFATVVQENVALTVGQAITLPIAMKVSGVAETVTVTTATRSALPGSAASSTTSASTAVITTTGSSASRPAGSGRRSTSPSTPSRSSR
jgi:hypothetical protein